MTQSKKKLDKYFPSQQRVSATTCQCFNHDHADCTRYRMLSTSNIWCMVWDGTLTIDSRTKIPYCWGMHRARTAIHDCCWMHIKFSPGTSWQMQTNVDISIFLVQMSGKQIMRQAVEVDINGESKPRVGFQCYYPPTSITRMELKAFI